MSTSSRVGRKPVIIPSGVEVKVLVDQISEVDQVSIIDQVSIKGPKGHMKLDVHPQVNVVVENGEVKIITNEIKGYVRKGSGMKLRNSVPGTMRSQINNAVHGVSVGFERKLQLVGVGYRAQSKGKSLSLTLGYSHPVEFPAPEGITIETPSVTEIIIKGIDKHLVGHTAAKIIDFRPPEPYKGKGIIDPRKPVKRKETKKK